MSPEEFEVKDGISRRKMLKRVGAGAAIAWSAPILTSIKTPAFAATNVFPCTLCDPNVPCNVLDPCGPSGTCACFVLANGGGCLCGAFPSNFCSDYPPCSSDADCRVSEGYVCQLFVTTPPTGFGPSDHACAFACTRDADCKMPLTCDVATGKCKP